VRVVSLVPSVTETLLAWQVDVVACTRFCEQPQLAHVGGTKDPDIDAIVALQPDVVVVDREENRRDDAQALQSAGLAVHVTHVVHIDQVEPTLRLLSQAVGIEERSIASEARAVADIPLDMTAFVPIWRRPTMSFGARTYASSMLARLGVRNALADHADTYPTVDAADVVALEPDLVLLPSEPYPFAERHLAEYQRSFPHARVMLVDGQDLFWWGVRTAQAVDRLRAVLRAPSTQW
jgi:ABC-type Fe3+-hydroxamate transport system substrate-binding protein